ncbi:hypothetical protein [Phenylobacterium sp. J367]|uniref:hypothetical protein n=1 Tax=Phenylobacterium sp. J367 TaxID=2898435 RepID=UPI002150F932|nr:hypothetical protein [Phenylobacterium sp. J367]MCR5881256.1 hypothetical protein [Phenylobacterium sp. J367]
MTLTDRQSGAREGAIYDAAMKFMRRDRTTLKLGRQSFKGRAYTGDLGSFAAPGRVEADVCVVEAGAPDRPSREHYPIVAVT